MTLTGAIRASALLGLGTAPERAGLTGFVAGLSRQVAKHNVTINNLLPGSHETDRLVKLTAAEARKRRIPVDGGTYPGTL